MADVAATAGWLWDRRDQVAARLAELWAWLRRDDRPILMLGPGGCGKTTLLRILSGERDGLVDRPWEYAESSGVDKRPLADAPHVQVVVPPGQSHRARRTGPTCGRKWRAAGTGASY